MAAAIWHPDGTLLAYDCGLEYFANRVAEPSDAKVPCIRSPIGRLLGFVQSALLAIDSLRGGCCDCVSCTDCVGFPSPVAVVCRDLLHFGLSWSAMQYVHHFGTARRD